MASNPIRNVVLCVDDEKAIRWLLEAQRLCQHPREKPNPDASLHALLPVCSDVLRLKQNSGWVPRESLGNEQTEVHDDQYVTQIVIWLFSPILVADEGAGWHLLSGVRPLRSGIRLRLGKDAEDDGTPSPTSVTRKYQQRPKPRLC